MQAIYDGGGSLKLAITLKDNLARTKSGRVYLDNFCAKHPIELLKVRNINDADAVSAVRANEIDWLFVIGWSQIVRAEILAAPRLGCIGIHPTLLPQGRGRAAIPWAILKGLKETGVTLFRLDEGVDTGPIIDQLKIPLDIATTATQLYEAVSHAHYEILKRNLRPLLDGTVNFRAQDESLATEWPGRRPEDGEVTENMSVDEVLCLIRAVTHPYPGAYIRRGSETIRIWTASATPKSMKSMEIRLNDGVIFANEFEIERGQGN